MMFARASLAALAGLLMSQVTMAADPVPAPTPVKPVYGNINPFYGNIGAFWGNINPFWGNIGAFWGNINPFYGDIGAFWGNINPFYGDISAFYGNIQPFNGDFSAHYGKIGTFWQGVAPLWTDLNGAWSNVSATDQAGLANIGTKLSSLISMSETFWGTAVKTRTGKSFMEGFAQPLLAKFKLDPANPASLAGLSESKRWEFIITWYDQLMEFSGMDHVDHWMKTINWTPAITQQQGEGYDAVIGLIDFTIAGDSDIQSKLSYFSGVSSFSNGHGAGVASLMVAAHDGRGVMGIAPNASVVAYNPFDATGTTNFAAIRDGIVALNARNTSVINMSLGVSGWTLSPDWKSVFSDPDVAKSYRNTVYVVAAGNDGTSQTKNIAWDYANDPSLIVVGSVAPDGTISSFSNQPGTACLLDAKGKCNKEAELMYRFMVAPGELILVSDDNGGVVRQTGTSLAAPLVSGTIALLHDRWPWLANYPKATVDILLRSAKDLGAKGVDPVYGWGLLDVAAAQSVLDFSKLVYYEVSDALSSNSLLGLKASSAGNIRAKGIQQSWESSGAYFIVFEPTTGTQRDFAIPLSSRLYGQKVSGSNELFQQFIYDRLVEWMKTGSGSKCTLGVLCLDQGAGYMSFADSAVTVPAFGDLRMSFGYAARQDDLFADTSSEYMLRLSTEDGAVALNAGYGRGAAVLGYQDAFGLASDYGSNGGVNPLLGLASGGSYASVDLALVPNLTFSAGFSQAGQALVPDQTYGRPAGVDANTRLDQYGANAFTVSFNYRPLSDVTLRASYTRLSERKGLLGVMSMQDDFAHVTLTDGVTIGGDLALSDGFSLGFNATLGKTHQSDNRLAVADSIESTAFEATVTKRGVFGEDDLARLTLGQPLHVEAGGLTYTQVGVVNRLTGELGLVSQTFGIGGGERRFQGEALYGTSFMGGRGEVGAFVKAEYIDSALGNRFGAYAGGVSVRFGF